MMEGNKKQATMGAQGFSVPEHNITGAVQC